MRRSEMYFEGPALYVVIRLISAKCSPPFATTKPRSAAVGRLSVILRPCAGVSSV